MSRMLPYDPDEGEFVDFSTLDDWQVRDKEKDAKIARLQDRVRELEGALLFYGSICADPQEARGTYTATITENAPAPHSTRMAGSDLQDVQRQGLGHLGLSRKPPTACLLVRAWPERRTRVTVRPMRYNPKGQRMNWLGYTKRGALNKENNT